MTMRDFPGPEITATWLGGVMMQLPEETTACRGAEETLRPIVRT